MGAAQALGSLPGGAQLGAQKLQGLPTAGLAPHTSELHSCPQGWLLTAGAAAPGPGLASHSLGLDSHAQGWIPTAQAGSPHPGAGSPCPGLVPHCMGLAPCNPGLDPRSSDSQHLSHTLGDRGGPSASPILCRPRQEAKPRPG